MELTLEILRTVLPALLCIGTAALIFTTLKRDAAAREREETRLRAFSTVMPLRVAAYERAILYLHRIQPENLVARAEPGNKTAAQLKDLLLEDLRVEYDHNAVQQLYVSDRAWNLLLTARNALLELVLEAYAELAKTPGGDRAMGPELVEKLFEALKEQDENYLAQATQALKQDVVRFFA